MESVRRRRHNLAILPPPVWTVGSGSRAVADCLARADALLVQLRRESPTSTTVADLEATLADLRSAVLDISAVMGVLAEAVSELHEVVGS